MILKVSVVEKMQWNLWLTPIGETQYRPLAFCKKSNLSAAEKYPPVEVMTEERESL